MQLRTFRLAYANEIYRPRRAANRTDNHPGPSITGE
jgi:hypothetical protein